MKALSVNLLATLLILVAPAIPARAQLNNPGVQSSDLGPYAKSADVAANYAPISMLSGYATTTTLGSTINTAVSAIPTLLPVYDHIGTNKTPSHMVVDTCILAVGSCTVTLTGSAAFTSATSYFCGSADQTAAVVASSVYNSSGSVFTIYGTLAHTIRYSCTGW